MNEPIINPYASPREEIGTTIVQKVVPAGQGARFVNLIIDQIAMFFIGAAVGVVIVVIWGNDGIAFVSGIGGNLVGFPISICYYVFFEATTSRTLGKFVTGTKVVNAKGKAPSFGQILGRSFARFIPFEPFSFFGTPTRGWHDSLAETYVVKAR